MAQFDASNSECLIFTYKEGLLSAVAHDLKLRVTRFEITTSTPVPGASGSTAPLPVSAIAWCSSVQVVNALKDGQETPSALSERDKQKIQATLQDEVLESRRFPEVRLVGTAMPEANGGYRLAGQLTLKGVSRPISAQLRDTAAGYVTELTLHQPDFGIKPYSAMLGALKIKPAITIRVETRLK